MAITPLSRPDPWPRDGTNHWPTSQEPVRRCGADPSSPTKPYHWATAKGRDTTTHARGEPQREQSSQRSVTFSRCRGILC
jgi:hypothetical protein